MQVALVVFQLQGILLSGLKLFLAYKRPAAEMAWCPTYAVWLALQSDSLHHKNQLEGIPERKRLLYEENSRPPLPVFAAYHNCRRFAGTNVTRNAGTAAAT